MGERIARGALIRSGCESPTSVTGAWARMAEAWADTLAAEVAETHLGELEALRVHLLDAAQRIPLGSAASAPARVALAFGEACEAADQMCEAVNGDAARARDFFGDRLCALGAACIAARAVVAAVGSEDEQRAAAVAVVCRLREMGRRLRAGGLLRCQVPAGPELIAHVGGLMGPLAVGASLIAHASIEHQPLDELASAGEGRQFARGERLVAPALRGLGDHAVDGALRLGA